MDQGNKSMFSQAESLQELTAKFIDDAVNNMNALSNAIDFNKLDGEKKQIFAEWHRGMQQASKAIRRPN